MHKTKQIKVSLEFSDYLKQLKIDFEKKSGICPSDRELSIFITNKLKDKSLIGKNEKKTIFKL